MHSVQLSCLFAILISAHSLAHSKPLLAIDVGHSLQKSGTTSARGQHEFAFNAALAKQVQQHFKDDHNNAILIGEDGMMSVLTQRTATAKQQKATFFLSIHHDSVQPKYLQTWQWQGVAQQYSDKFSGFSLFVSKKNPQLAKSLQCASAIGSALKQAGFHPSEHHAEAIEGENKTWADQENGVYYYDNLIVLKTAPMPAVLLEAGVIVNRDEELRIQETTTQMHIAHAIKHGLTQCGMMTPS